MTNPLLSRAATPDFTAIKPEHYLPALEAALDAANKKLAALRDNPETPSFANTVIPLDNLFNEVRDVLNLLGNATANTYTKELGAIEEQASLKLSAAMKNTFQDPVLGARFRAVYDAKDALNLDADDKAILKHLHDAFEENGALLPAAGQKRIREIDEKLISLAQKFKDNMQEAPKQNAVLITDAAELKGLSADEISGFESDARANGHNTGWLVIPERLMVDELLERAENSGFRKKIFTALNQLGTQAPFDNRPVIDEMLQLRDDYAKLLGYPHYADFARSRAMKKDLGATRQFLKDVAAAALPKFEADMKELEKFSAAHGGPAKLEPWDVSYWAMQQRDALYNFDANGFAKYLELENVLKGMFAEAGHLFNIDFKETRAYSALHPDIRSFEVTDKSSGAAIGILQVDMFARPGEKSGGAWMSQLQDKTAGRPNMVVLNMNIAKPPAGKPALIGLSQYITLYHEMGHSLHGLLGTHVKHRSLQGTAAPMDYVEFHSMVNEKRAVLKENLQQYARHVDTGAPAPDALLNALNASKAHFESREMLKLVQNSLRDLEFHSVEPKDYKGDAALEKSVELNSPYAEHIRPYPLARFGHLFSDAHGGYAAGYVNYLIAQEHAADGFEPFEKAPYDAKQAEKLLALYRRGGGGDPAQLYRDYRGRDAKPDAMLRDAGIAPANTNTPEKPAALKPPAAPHK